LFETYATEHQMTTPTDDQIDELWDEIGSYYNLYPEVRNTVREALNRWGTPEPIALEDGEPQQIDLNNELTGVRMKSFNINETVKVRLTKYGKELYKKQWVDFWNSVGRLEENPYTPPEEDENGYVQFQMWDLMEKFGNHCGLCRELAFETVILIDERHLEDA
jgi:hypothetical protein